jgi:peptidoglycan/LPS O-acetylase OafA/YrhL
VALWLWSKGRLAGWQAAVLAVLGLYAQYVHTSDLSSTAGLAVLFAAMAAAAGGPDWDRVLPRRAAGVVRWLAGISYGVYLLNQEIGYLLMYRVHQAGGAALAQVPVAVGAAVLSGWLLTRWVERPAHRALTQAGAGARVRRRAGAALRWLVTGGGANPRAWHHGPDHDPALLPALLITSQLR